MKRRNLFWAALLLLFLANARLIALDNLTAKMKQILDQRTDDFAAIRVDPHGTGDETTYTSALSLPGAKQCYIARTSKPHFSNECDMLETKSRAVLTAKYKLYVKALQDTAPSSWAMWTEHPGKSMGESTYFGPDRSHPAAAVHWMLEGMNLDWYGLSVAFYGDGYTLIERM
jgi:hypothetical protein